MIRYKNVSVLDYSWWAGHYLSGLVALGESMSNFAISTAFRSVINIEIMPEVKLGSEA